MNPRKYAHERTIHTSGINSLEHTLFILSIIQETETIRESYLADDIEGVAL